MKYLKKWWKTKEHIERGIESEEEMQRLFKDAYDQLKNQKELSLGLDDYLMTTANAHETHLYLLGQTKQ